MAEAIDDATAIGGQRVGSVGLDYAVRQLVEVAVRALSPGINDPHTAMSVLERLGAALCDVVPLHLPDGVYLREGRVVLIVPALDYAGLVGAMFDLIRQNAAGSAAVLTRLLEVLTAIVAVERQLSRQRVLSRHADLALHDAERDVATPADLDEVRRHHRRFQIVLANGPLATITTGAA